MSTLNYKDPVSGEIKKVGFPKMDLYNKQQVEAKIDEKIAKQVVCNPNLLDNWYFGNPVDQRGGYISLKGTTVYNEEDCTNVVGPQIEDVFKCIRSGNNYQRVYSAGSNGYVKASDVVRGYCEVGYTIDRWYSYREDTTTLITEDGLQLINNNPSNYIEFVQRGLSQQLIGKTVTASCLTASNELVTGHTTIYAGMDVNVCFGSKIRLNLVHRLDGTLELRFLGDDTETIKAVKLELGDKQTLAHQDAEGNWVLNEIPDYNEQLIRCCMSTADPNDTYANNNRTPAAIGAVNKAGDTMTGNLSVPNSVIFGRGTVQELGNGEVAVIINSIDKSSWRYLGVCGPDWVADFNRSFRYVECANGNHTIYEVLHTGNKPFGSYTGNGSATQRTIQTGGIGRVISIESVRGDALVLGGSTIIINGNELKSIMYPATFFDGVLTINSEIAQLNENGVTYTYQVL